MKQIIYVDDYTQIDLIAMAPQFSDDCLCDIIQEMRETIPDGDHARNWIYWDEFNALQGEICRRAELKGWHLELAD